MCVLCTYLAEAIRDATVSFLYAFIVPSTHCCQSQRDYHFKMVSTPRRAVPIDIQFQLEIIKKYVILSLQFLRNCSLIFKQRCLEILMHPIYFPTIGSFLRVHQKFK